jgi:predicted GNAT family acetyltransferase
VEKFVNPVQVVSLDKNVEKKLFEFMDKDRIRNFWGIHDLKHLRNKTRTWVALSQKNVVGYLVEHDQRILHTRGDAECVNPLLKNTDLVTPMFNIESSHLSAVKRLYKPTEPTDVTTRGKITTYLSMKVSTANFKPATWHNVQEMGKEDNEAVKRLLGRETSRVTDLLKGLAYGLYKQGQLLSFAAAPEILEDLAIIRGVYTTPDLRGRGYSTSVCSALVGRILEQGRDAILYVSKDNEPAIRVYRKLGFRKTGHVFLGFKARRNQKKASC